MNTLSRIERDTMGEIRVPAAALYGAQTQRAVENFPVSGLRPLPAFVDAVIWIKKAAALYEWFLPLLRMDTVNKFVQLIKLVQQETGMGSERVRGPRLTLAGAEREAALATIRSALAARPRV